jgi:imidazolonepropionase-like amidohydrolase
MRTLISNVSIFDGTGDDVFRGRVLIENDRIAAVDRSSTEPSVADARVIDGQGATLMPGLTDGHAHLGLPCSIERSYPTLYAPPGETALITVHNARILLDHGFTNAYSAGAIKPGIEPKLRDDIDAGRLVGPRLRAASAYVYFPGDPEYRPVPREPLDIRQFVRDAAVEGVDVVKLWISGLTGFLPWQDWDMLLSDEAVAVAEDEASRRGVSLSCHVRPVAGLKLALRHGFRMLYHVEEVDDEALDLMERRKNEIFCGPTIGGIGAAIEHGPESQRGDNLARMERYRDTVSRIRERGVRIVPGGDYGIPDRLHGHNARDITYIVRYLGLTPTEALVSATRWGGELMGMGRERIGVVAPGYLADLILVDGDPLADVSILEDPGNFLMIMKGGAFHKRVESPADVGSC